MRANPLKTKLATPEGFEPPTTRLEGRLDSCGINAVSQNHSAPEALKTHVFGASVKPLRALDLFCCAGGATRGLQLAGFHVTGVDIVRHKNYCGDRFKQADALSFGPQYLRRFDFIWASPPCQAHTAAQAIQGREHPDLIPATRAMLQDAGVPFCIENVPGAPLINPLRLTGTMFGLRTIRPRLFECNFPVPFALEPPPPAQQKMGRKPRFDGDYVQVVGNFSDVAYGRKAMGIDWMSRAELAQAIPPAYAEYIGRAAIAHIQQARAA